MPDDLIDLDAIGRAATLTAPPVDLDAIGRLAPLSKPLQLRQEQVQARQAGARADVGLGVITEAERQAQHGSELMNTVLNSPFYASRALGWVPPDQQPPFGGPIIPKEYVSNTIEFFDPTGQTQIVGTPARGISQGVSEMVSGLTTPEMLPFAATGGLAPLARRAIGAGFSGLMANEVAPAASKLGEATVTGTPEDQAKALTELGFAAGFTAAPVAHYAGETTPAWHEAVINTDAQMMRDYFQRQAEAPQRAETAQMIKSVRGATPGRRAADRVAQEEAINVPQITTEPAAQAPVPVREPAAAGGGTAPELLPGVSRTQDAGIPTMAIPLDFTSAKTVAKNLNLEALEQPGAGDFPTTWQFNYQPEGKTVLTFNLIEGATRDQIASRLQEKIAEFEAGRPAREASAAARIAQSTTEVPSAIPVQSPATIPVREASTGGQTMGQEIRSPEELAGTRSVAGPEVTAEAAPPQVSAAQVAPEPSPRLTLKSNVFAAELPEIPLARKDNPGDVIAASIGYDPKGFISVRGASKLSSYRIPLSALPKGSWEYVKGGLSADRTAVLDFLNDPVKRRSAMSVTGNPKRFHPEDIAENLKTAKPVGRPSTGEGAPLGEVTVEPKKLEAIAPAVPARPAEEMGSITRAAFDRLLQVNPELVATLLQRRSAELDDAFWAGVKAELAKMPEYADDPRKADALTASLKAVKESGSGELEWYQSRGGTVVGTPLDLTAAQSVVEQLVGGRPSNIRFVAHPGAPLGFVFFERGGVPRIDLNLLKHSSPEALRDTLLEELLHPLQGDPALRTVLAQIEARITEADIARQREAGYRPDELLNEATNELLRTLYQQHAESNVFRRAVNQVVLAVKRAFGLQLNDQQVALFLVNRALKNRRAAASGKAFALESPEKVEEYTAPMTHEPEFYRSMASVLNKGLVPPPVMARLEALSPGARGELAKMFPGRIGTYLDASGNVVDGPSFQDVMRNASRTPEERNDYARHGLAEYVLYQKDRADVHRRLEKTMIDLDEAVIKSISDTPRTNEAELLATNLLGGILDKIKTERGEAVEGAQTNERIREGIENISRLNELLKQPAALDRAMRGIANQVGRDALMAAKPGEEALELISSGTGFGGGVFATPREWIGALATHLDQLTRSDGEKAILASRDVIEAALYGLRQVADARQTLLEVQMTNDGTLRRFNEDYLADLQSKSPKGFTTVLKKYAKAQVESDALTSAFKRLNKRIDTLTERGQNLYEATQFLNQHDLDPEFRAFGQDVVKSTGAMSAVEYTENGPVVEFVHPLTGDPVRIDFGFNKTETVENIKVLSDLADAGLSYAAQPNADPLKAAFWNDFAGQIQDYKLVASPDYDRLQDPLINPLRMLTKSKFGLIAETTLSRIPGALALETTRAIEAFAIAMKAKNEYQKDNEAKVLAANIAAQNTHARMTLDQWQKEVAAAIIDSRQHYGQTVYRAGDSIPGFGHVVTREDMKAVDYQYRYEQTLRHLHERARIPAVTDNPAKIKEGNIQRLAMSRGPGTVTRIIPRSTRDLPGQWREAVETPVVEGQPLAVDTFLKSGDNFTRVMLGHVMEEDRDYFLLGKGQFARDYRALRLEKQALQASGEMPNNLDSLSEWIANHHNDHLAEGVEPVTAGDVRKELIEQVSSYMAKIGEDTLEKANAAKMDIVSYENGFTQPRGGKIAPGTLYQYGLPDRAAIVSKGNDAVEFYAIRYRDSLQTLHTALMKQREELTKSMQTIYGSEGIGARRKLDKGIRAGNDEALQRYQLTSEEVERNISRIGILLNNMQDIIKNREQFFGDDIANRIYSPWLGAAVGSVLMRPKTWLVNGASGSAMWAMKTAEVRNGGWLMAPPVVLKNHIVSFMNTIRLKFIPKNAKERAIKKFLDENPELTTGTAEFVSALLKEVVDREALRRMGVIDSFSVGEYLGWDSERTKLQNLKAAVDTLRNVSARPDTSAVKAIFSYLGIAPRAYQILTRKIGMRWADNWINGQSTQFANGLAEQLRIRSIKAFDARLKNDPVFKQIYEEYGDNYLRFANAITGHGDGALLTPAEITGRFNPLNMDKAAVQLRRTFIRNGDSADLLMLRYWWNKRHPNGDRNAPFMTDGQRYALMFSLAEDVNLGTLASRATWFAGSRHRQWLGVLSQYWLWVTDRLSDLVAKTQGQKTFGARYLPAVGGFLLVSAFAALLSNTVGQKANDALFNTVSQKPSFWDATDDAARLKILFSNTASYWGAIGSVVSMLMDTPGKLGYRNPVFFANVLTDVIGAAVNGVQSGDYSGQAMNLLAKYNPVAQAVINRLPSREGLVEVRNAANNLRAATPDSMEAKRRQPSSGSDFRATPMTPLYNAILNQAAVGNWSSVDELMTKAVEQQRAQGNANPESAILSAIRTRSPESAVYQRVLTPEEREVVYSRMTPEARAQVEKTNAVFDELASRYGRGGVSGAGGGAFGGLGGRISTPKFGQIAPTAAIGGGALSLGSAGGVRRGFRTRSMMRGGRSRSLLRGGRLRMLRTRLPRLRV